MPRIRKTLIALLALVLLAGVPLAARAVVNFIPAAKPDPTAIIVELIRPQKLATLGQRGANTRVQKIVYWIEMARRSGQNITNVITTAVTRASYTNGMTNFE